MPTFDYAATALSVAAISTILVQWIKTLLIDPHMDTETAQHDTLIQVVSFVINLVLLILALLARGQFSIGDWVGYVGTAAAQFGASTGAYHTLVKPATKTVSLHSLDAPSAPPTAEPVAPLGATETT